MQINDLAEIPYVRAFTANAQWPKVWVLGKGRVRMGKSECELLDSIRAGKGKAMPAWLGVLRDEDCEAVLQFIRETLS